MQINDLIVFRKLKCATQQKLNGFVAAGIIKQVTASAVLMFCTVQLTAQNYVKYVQTLSGTAPSTTTSALKHSEAGSEKNANTIPAVTLPFAMTQWTAQTRQTEIKCQPPYYYKDNLLTGFRGTHWISGSCTQDYGSFTVMPVTGSLKTLAKDYAVPFTHENETTGPANYQLELPSAHLRAELTATLRCGVMRFTMLKDDSLYLLIIPNSDQQKGFVQMNAANGEVWGFNPVHRIYQGWGQPAGFSGWFYFKIEKTVAASGTFSGDQVFKTDRLQNQKDMGAYLGFKMKKGEQLLIRIGTSFTGLEGAKNNLKEEVGTKTFQQIKSAATATWQQALSQIKVQSANEKEKQVFYTGMYHAMQHPRLMSDADGAYPRFAGKGELMYTKSGTAYYDDFSMWDIYRAQLPLLEIIKPKLVSNLVQSLILKGEQGGWLPIFPCWNSYTAAMIGDHSTAFIASAYAKGIRGYNTEAAYKLMRQNAFTTPKDFSVYVNGMGRRALTSYLKYGFIPMEDSVQEAFHKKEQVSRTLEYAYDDYALSIVAKGLKKKDDYQMLHQRSFNYRNVFDTTVKMVRGRYSNGNWYESFHADKRESYITEGTPRHYTFYVPQDIPGLAKLMGGTKQLENALDSLFAKDEYWHGNEPGHQIPFLYNYTSSPWKTQQVVKKILTEEYSNGAGGLSGNDDAGQMSAWYVFAAIGFYPVDPVSNNYQLCTPLFDEVVIRVTANKTIKLITHKSSAKASYISNVKWNGKLYNKNYITYKMLHQGGTLDIYLQNQPSAWGSSVQSRAGGLNN